MTEERLIDAHVEEMDLIPPIAVRERFPLTEEGERTTQEARRGIEAILRGEDNRKLLVMGPCSTHEIKSIYEYAEFATELGHEVSETILVVGRLYFEKPRTISRPTKEWEGLITDPYGDGNSNTNEGYMLAREIAAHVVNNGLPIATEFVDTFTPRYLNGTIAWAAIGARTVESQIHRHMASGLSMPVGYKNTTSGNERRAMEAYITAFHPGHTFPGISDFGVPKIERGTGNRYGHVVLRGGDDGPNYSPEDVARVQQMMLESPDYQETDMPPNVLIDCSHANANKDYTRQRIVFEDALQQIVDGNRYINGWMLESHLKEGRQSVSTPLRGFAQSNLEYGQSITDACIGLETTLELVRDAHSTLLKTVHAAR